MPERTAAEVLAGKLSDALSDTVGVATESWGSSLHLQRAAARLVEDPAVTVRTDLVVERFVVEFHHTHGAFAGPLHSSDQVRHVLIDPDSTFTDRESHRIVVRPYPEESS